MKLYKLLTTVTSAISIVMISACSTPSNRQVAQDYKPVKEIPKTGSEFIVDWMTCSGPAVEVAKDKKSDFVVLKFGSYLTQKDTHGLSGTTYAHTLRVREEYGDNEADAQKQMQETEGKSYDTASYDTPLVFNQLGHIVDGEDADFGPIDLEITGGNTDETYFKGTYGNLENKYGYGYYNLTCKGRMMDAPTRVIDTTNVCRRMAKESILEKLMEKNLNCTVTGRADYKNNKLNTFFVTARCDDKKMYSYTVVTKSKGNKSCEITSSTHTGTRNIHK